MKIAIDLMGGDFAPDAVIEGVKQYYREKIDNNTEYNINNNSEKETLFLVGIETNFENSFFQEEIIFDSNDIFENEKFKIHKVVCNSYIKMEENPLSFFQTEEDSNLDYTIIKCIQLVKEKVADICYSAGNSGAVIFTALNILKLKNNNSIPAIATFIPSLNKDTKSSGYSLLLDVGASGNKPIKAESLINIADLGIEFFNEFNKKIKTDNNSNARIGLLNIGSEEWKGTKDHRIAYENLKKEESQKNQFQFVGNVEADKLLYTDADIIITDGFTGNIVLKLLESFKNLLGSVLKNIDKNNSSDLSDNIASKFSYEGIGGAPLLGFEEKIVIGHGKSSAKAICSAITFCKKYTS